MSKEAMKLAASVLKGSQEYKRGHATFVEAVEELEEALAEQPAPAAHQEPVASLSETQAKAILVLALDLEKTGRAVAIAEGQERTDFVARNRNIQCALEDALRNATTPQAQPAREFVGMTDEEVIEISHLALTRVQAVRMTEAKLKEKNHA